MRFYKSLFIFLSALNPFFGLSQSKDLIDSINKVIGKNYDFFVSNVDIGIYSGQQINIVDLDKDDNNEIEISASDSNEIKFKIFILKSINSHLKIIDSSCLFKQSKDDCNVYFSNDSIIIRSVKYMPSKYVNSDVLISLNYKWDLLTQKFFFKSITAERIINDFPIYQKYYVETYETLNLEKGELTLLSELHNIRETAEQFNHPLHTKKINFKKNVENVKCDLSQMKDPKQYFYLFDFSGDIYHKILDYQLH